MTASSWVVVCIVLYFFCIVRLTPLERRPPDNNDWESLDDL